MEYRHTDGTIKTDSEIRADNVHTSFPKGGLTADILTHLGYTTVVSTPSPTPSSNLKRFVRNGVEKDSDGNWSMAWKEEDLHADYKDADGKTVTKSTQDTAHLVAIDESKKEILRIERMPLLEEADWQIHKLEDSGGDASAWRSYRQKLREITDGDIYNVTWPTKPI